MTLISIVQIPFCYSIPGHYNRDEVDFFLFDINILALQFVGKEIPALNWYNHAERHHMIDYRFKNRPFLYHIYW